MVSSCCWSRWRALWLIEPQTPDDQESLQSTHANLCPLDSKRCRFVIRHLCLLDSRQLSQPIVTEHISSKPVSVVKLVVGSGDSFPGSAGFQPAKGRTGGPGTHPGLTGHPSKRGDGFLWAGSPQKKQQARCLRSQGRKENGAIPRTEA